MNERDFIREYVSRRAGGRPVRWADARTTRGDFDGREWTLELFDIPRTERRRLQDELWELREQVWGRMGRALVFIFHTPEATERHYAWVREEAPRRVETSRPGRARLPASGYCLGCHQQATLHETEAGFRCAACGNQQGTNGLWAAALT